MRDDHRAGLAQRLVAAGVVAVPVSVDDVLDVAAARAAHGREDLGVERRVLRVDEHGPIRTGRQPDIAAVAHQHEDVAGELLRLDRNGRRVLLCQCRHAAQGRRDAEHQVLVDHALVPPLAWFFCEQASYRCARAGAPVSRFAEQASSKE
jgi:hypothetical protein